MANIVKVTGVSTGVCADCGKALDSTKEDVFADLEGEPGEKLCQTCALKKAK